MLFMRIMSYAVVVLLTIYFELGESLELSAKMARGNPYKKPSMAPPNQRNFKILSRKIEFTATYGDYVSDKTFFKVEMYNESMPVINGRFYLLKDFPPSMKIQVLGARFSPSNQWVPTFDQGKQLYCDYFENNVSFMKNVLIASNFKKCPIKKGEYSITNMVIDEKGFPPGVPECKFKIDAFFTIGNKQIARLTVFADVSLKDEDDDD